ncbi:DUF5050 domain-containing protein [Paenibacillus sp. LMG 31458]|uniref:DUF5050 domain-containing protein n=1 Tax=Paenibacillus phytorum TaxID=2654977 RepID=A0ABX1XYN3_9BACL|nr:DUF5050 domain-containing protein [Paenibacillus phytorum]NOU73680.1 DUF5050 domain-containing protein [Paenibacillus phytorum]
MFKKISLCLSAIVIGFSSSGLPQVSQASSSSDIQVNYPIFPVTVNGTAMDVSHSEYPLLVYKDITYFPMTWNNTSALGMSVQWDAVNGLSLQKNDTCVPLKQNLSLQINSNVGSQKAALLPFPVKVNGQSIINSEEPYPVLFYRDITYFPMTWRFTHDVYGWSTSWDDGRGFGIESCGGTSNTQTKQSDDLNLANGGQVAVQGDWIYMNPANNYEGPNRLVKVKKDGSGEVKLADDNAKSINIVGDWLYYTVSDPSKNKMEGIFKIKTDGSLRSLVSAIPTTQISVQDGWIYYIRQTFQQSASISGGGYFVPSSLYRMKLDGSAEKELVGGEGISQFFIDTNENGIYFLMQDTKAEPGNLYRMNLDGSARKKLQDNVTKAFVIDKWLYYIHNYSKQLSKLSEDGSVNIPLYTSDEWISTIHYRKGEIYMVRGSFGIHGSAVIDKLKIDGTGLTRLGQARATALYFADKTLYYPQSWMGNNPLEHIEVN